MVSNKGRALILTSADDKKMSGVLEGCLVVEECFPQFGVPVEEEQEEQSCANC